MAQSLAPAFDAGVEQGSLEQDRRADIYYLTYALAADIVKQVMGNISLVSCRVTRSEIFVDLKMLPFPSFDELYWRRAAVWLQSHVFGVRRERYG